MFDGSLHYSKTNVDSDGGGKDDAKIGDDTYGYKAYANKGYSNNKDHTVLQ